MLGLLFNNAHWAMVADIIVAWILGVSIFICYWKEYKEGEEDAN